MRFSFTVLFFSLMMFEGTSFAQNETDSLGNQKKIISHVGKQWYIGSTPVKQVIIDNALKTNPYSANDYSTAKAIYYPAMLLAFTGVAGIGYGLITPLGAVFGNSSSLEAGKYLVVGGLIIGGIGLVLGKVSNNYLDSSIELYNKNVGNESAFKVKLVPTEKGGLALAFAF